MKSLGGVKYILTLSIFESLNQESNQGFCKPLNVEKIIPETQILKKLLDYLGTLEGSSGGV